MSTSRYRYLFILW